MKKQSLGSVIAELRRKNGMTQLDLAEKMGVTDKAVSKWERGLSCPDVSSIPKLAELFGVSVDELMQVKTVSEGSNEDEKPTGKLIDLILKGVSLAMGVCVTVLSIINEIDPKSAFGMLGIGLACLALSQLGKKEN